jgi:hypothetical protein
VRSTVEHLELPSALSTSKSPEGSFGWKRVLTGLVVTIAGVLIALAADRRNQIRLQPAAADEYLNPLDTAVAVDLEECRTAA